MHLSKARPFGNPLQNPNLVLRTDPPQWLQDIILTRWLTGKERIDIFIIYLLAFTRKEGVETEPTLSCQETPTYSFCIKRCFVLAKLAASNRPIDVQESQISQPNCWMDCHDVYFKEILGPQEINLKDCDPLTCQLAPPCLSNIY